MTSIVILFVRLVAPFTSLGTTTGRLSAKNDSAELIL